MLYYSPNGGKSWSTAYQATDDGQGFNDLGFTTPSDGVVVRAPAMDDSNSEHNPGQFLQSWLYDTVEAGAIGR